MNVTHNGVNIQLVTDDFFPFISHIT